MLSISSQEPLSQVQPNLAGGILVVSEEWVTEWVIGFNVIYQQFRASMTVVVRSAVTGADSSWVLMCQLAYWNTILQINMIPHPVTLNWHWANQPCSRSLMVNANQASSRCQFFSLWLDQTGALNPGPSTLGARQHVTDDCLKWHVHVHTHWYFSKIHFHINKKVI